MRMRNNSLGIFGSIKVMIIMIVLLGFGYNIIYYSSAEVVQITVKDKERIVETNNNKVTSKFLVYTDTGVFENSDEIMFFKFNSSDVQNNLEVGKTYSVRVAGWRVPFFSMYKNIIKIN